MIVSFLLVGLGGGIGALSRLLFSTLAKKAWGNNFPWGTFLINIIGSFLLGLAAGHNLDGGIKLLFMTGMIGAFTTFSTFNYEAVTLLKSKKNFRFFVYVAGTYVICMTMTGIGYCVA